MIFGLVVFALAVAVVLAVAQMAFGNIGVGALVLAAVAGWLAVSSVHIVLEWEKAVVLRLGKFNRVAGPGVVFTWPIIEFYTLRVDQRVSATYFGAEETLTSDLVPINVDAVVGVRRGGRLCRGRLVGGADRHAQGHRPGDGGRSGHAPRPA